MLTARLRLIWALSWQGLAALLVKGLSGCSAEEIVRVEASDVIDALGLSASLTPSRNNGFLNMFRLMQKKSLSHLAAQVRLPLRAEGFRIKTVGF